jgi:hypothetical protein
VIKIGGQPGVGSVTVIALGQCRQMIRRLAGTGHTVVTTRTAAYHLEVVNLQGRFPYGGTVTVFAYVCCVDMFKAFAGSDDTVMTGDTGVGDTGVIKVGRYPAIGRVTVIALRQGWYMIQWLACGGHPIVATRTTTQYLEVVDRHGRCPDIGAVAVDTFVGRTDMVQTFTGGSDIVMTADAIAGDVQMIEVGR